MARQDAMKDSWVEHFMGMAGYVAGKSKDPSTKVGCVIVGLHEQVLASGYNGFPRGVADTEERLDDRDTKLKLIVHAEANAVAAAARTSTSLYLGKAFVTVMPPCPQCAALLVQAGINEVYCPPPDPESRWHDLCCLSVDLLAEARVKVFYV